jgi:hypothetical protein
MSSRFDLALRLPYEQTMSGWMTPLEIAMNEEHADDLELLRGEGHAPIYELASLARRTMDGPVGSPVRQSDADPTGGASHTSPVGESPEPKS